MDNQKQRKNSARANRKRWPSGMRMRLVARESLVDRMDEKGWSNRRLAKYAECAPGTIDNLTKGPEAGGTASVNGGRVAELICEALDVQLRVYFVPEISSKASEVDKQQEVGRGANQPRRSPERAHRERRVA